jgi:hypothetical protein
MDTACTDDWLDMGWYTPDCEFTDEETEHLASSATSDGRVRDLLLSWFGEGHE